MKKMFFMMVAFFATVMMSCGNTENSVNQDTIVVSTIDTVSVTKIIPKYNKPVIDTLTVDSNGIEEEFS